MTMQENPDTQKLLLNASEAGALLGVSRETVYRMVGRHELPHVRLGSRVVVPRRELEQWISEQAQASVQPVGPVLVGKRGRRR
jgi:excisionase family DNA binding protein